METPTAGDHVMEDAPDHFEDQPTYQPMALARPTVGGLRLPINPPGPVQPVVVYLDLLPSDGDATKWRVNVPKYTVEPSVVHSARFTNVFCARQDLQALCGGPFTIKGLPMGYQMMVSDRGRDQKIFGHPSGSWYRSMRDFGVHIAFMMDEALPNCNCVLCSMPTWRNTAPVNAVLRVGLPLVLGGAVTAAIAQSPARLAREQADLAAQLPPVQPQLPIAHYADIILGVDLSWTNYTRDELNKSLNFIYGLNSNLDDVDAVVVVRVTDDRANWELDLVRHHDYMDHPDAHTQQQDYFWNYWLIIQHASVEAIKAAVKIAKTAQENIGLLRLAWDVDHLGQPEEDIVDQAVVDFVAQNSLVAAQGQVAAVNVKEEPDV